MSSSFHFKEFSIKQDKCAMKVGTDGVLLGAWISAIEGNLLDIGCGTGLLSLMMAQRVENASIDAIDIEEQAFLQCVDNVKESKWSLKITTHHSSIQQYKTSKKYQLIFSNPPYFVKSTKAPNQERSTARHTDELPFEELINGVINLLNANGIFALIMPVGEAEIFIQLATEKGLFLTRKCSVKPNEVKPLKRVLMEFSFQEKSILEEELTIETDKRHHYTKDYINLTKDFYLDVSR